MYLVDSSKPVIYGIEEYGKYGMNINWNKMVLMRLRGEKERGNVGVNILAEE